jgi:predicted outer membrane protein
MRLKHTKLMLAGVAISVALPAMALSQDRQQEDRQGQMNGAQRQQASPEQNKQLVEKWYKHQASSNQCEVELAQLAMERLGGGAQPGMSGDQPRQPGAGGGTGADRPGGQQQPGGGTGGTDRPGSAQPGQQQAGGMQPGAGESGSTMSQHREKLVQIAQMMHRDHSQAIQDLRKHAEQDGVQLSETPELEPVHRAKLDEMRQKQGEEFVRAFAFGNMASHTHGILELSWAQENGPTEGIKQFARSTLPRVQQHARQVAPVAYDIAGLREAQTAGFGEEPQQKPGDSNRPRTGNDRPGDGTGGTNRPGGSGGSGSDRPDNL